MGFQDNDLCSEDNVMQRLGTLQNGSILRFCLPSRFTKHLTLFQRLSGIIYCTSSYTSSLPLGIGLIMLPCLLATGQPLIAVIDKALLKRLLQVLLAATVTGRLGEYISSLPYGYRLRRRHSEASLWLLPYLAVKTQTYMIPKHLKYGRRRHVWQRRLIDSCNERSAQHRQNLVQRAKFIFFDQRAAVFALYLIAYWTAIITGLRKIASAASTHPSHPHPYVLTLATSTFYPSIPTLHFTCSFLGPLIYTIWPPTVPPRRAMMEQVPNSEIWRPKAAYKGQQWSWRIWITEVPHDVTLLWMAWLVWQM